MSHVHGFSCIRTVNSIYFIIFVVWYFFDCLPLFLSFSPSYISCVMAPKRKSIPSRNPLHSGASSSSSPFDPTLSHVRSVMRRPNQTSWRTFHDATFIRNAKSFCQTSLTLIYPLSSTEGVRSHFIASQSRALLWSYKSSTPICMDLITLYLSFLLTFRVYVW